MKAILKFNLSDRDDAKSHYRAVRALDMSIALFDIHNLLFHDEIEDIDVYKQLIRGVFEDRSIDVSKLID